MRTSVNKQSAGKQSQPAVTDKPGWWQRARRTFRFLGIITIPLIVASGMLVYGVQGVLLAHRFPAPKTLTYAEFARRMPQSGWYRISMATVDLSHAVIRHTASKSRGYQIDGYYAPVYGPGEPVGGPCHLLLCVTDDSIPDQSTVTRPLEGLIETDLDKSTPLNRDISVLGSTLMPDYRILDDAYRPNFGLSLTLALIGAPLTLLNLVALGAFFFDKSQTSDFDTILDGTPPKRSRQQRIRSIIK